MINFSFILRFFIERGNFWGFFFSKVHTFLSMVFELFQIYPIKVGQRRKVDILVGGISIAFGCSFGGFHGQNGVWMSIKFEGGKN